MIRLLKNKLFYLFLLLISLLTFSFIGCNKENPDDNKDGEEVTIAITGASIVYVGEEIQLVAEVTNSNEAVTWTSSDESIATVSEGVVKGIKAGSVIIKATVGEKYQELTIRVKTRVEEQVSLFCGTNIVTENILIHNKVEISLVERELGFVKANYNPYDYNQIKVYGVFTSPSRETNIVAIAFWYRDYNIRLDTNLATGKVKEGEPDGMELCEWTGDYEYRMRFQPNEVGKWTFKVYCELENSDIYEELDGEIEVLPSEDEYKGLIRIDKSNNRTFIYEDGSTFIPIGENMGWWENNSSRKTYDYYVWFENSNKNNMNVARIWMAPWGFAFHSKSFNNFDDRQNCAARLDKVIEYADQFGIYIMLTLLNHGQFSTGADPTWSSNPYNKANGGILNKPEDFFVNQEAKEVYKSELLYIIGRYGYSDNILCWELFNEVDWTDNSSLNAINIKNWHEEMGEFIRMNDSYNHLISTSYKTETGISFKLDIIDFACPHSYGYANKNICDTLPDMLDKLYKQYNKPILHAEIGIDWQNGYNNYKLDPTGVHLRQDSWAGMMGGGAGGAMNWWWDSYVHPYDLYYQFKGAGSYAKLLDLTGSDYTQLRTLEGVSKSSGVGLLGYRFDNSIYGYVYDTAWKYNNQTGELSNITVAIPFTNGTYTLTFYNALTGEVISETTIPVSNGKVNITLPDFTNDIAFIIK